MAPNSKPAAKRKPRNQSLLSWVSARRAVQYAALGAFLLIFLYSKQDGWPTPITNMPMRLDPLLMLSHLFSSRIFLPGSMLALITIALTILFGRAWCGWFCPLGTVLDLFPMQKLRGKRPPLAESWRKTKYGLLIVTLAAALLGNLTLLIFDPLTILFRSLSTAIWPALDQIIMRVEELLFSVPVLATPISVIDQWIRPGIFPAQPLYYRDAVLFGSVFLAVILLNVLAPRAWCRYLCPLGGLLGLMSKAGLYRRQVKEECKGCTLCTAACPTGTINAKKGYASDPSECTMCLECLETCPRGFVTFQPKISMAKWNEYDPNRRDALLALGGAIAWAALYRSNPLAKREPPHLLRPPGVRTTETDLISFSRCIRCSECVRACPTQALQLATAEAGLEGAWTPLLIPRIGYCDYACNICGQICPVQAIPPLSLEEKRLEVIGKAYIDQDRCIAWSDHQDCIVCEEMCPLPQKAIQLEETQVWGPGNSSVTIRLPHVLREQCIGCGICEYKCPVNGEAAIRVFVPEAMVFF